MTEIPPESNRPGPLDRSSHDSKAEAETLADAGVTPGEDDRAADEGTAHPEGIGPYSILGNLGSGGMGSVYLAQQEEPVRREVALKVIKLGMDTDEVIARFESERQALAMMNHPAIAQVFDAGATEDGRPYFAMEHADGIPVTRFCDQHGLDVDERLRLFVRICRGIQHAHQKGIIHRDIKPTNVLVSMQDGEPTPKVIDFGIAKATTVSDEDDTQLTRLGAVVGTPHYMSPEQASEGDVDTRTDIYSLGVLLYEMLTGDLPFRRRDPGNRESLETLLRVIREEEPSRPSARVIAEDSEAERVARALGTDRRGLGRKLGGDLDWITLTAMEKDRDRRYASVSELAADIERYLGDEPVSASPPTVRYRLGKFARKNKGPLTAAAALLLVMTVGAVVSSWLAIEATAARREADRRREQAEDLIGFMIGDLRGRLEPLNRLDVLDAVGDEALAYFAAIPETELSDEELYRRAETLAQIGDVRITQGDLPAAMEVTEEALALNRALVARDPANQEWLFGLGQSLFWVGSVHWWQGDLDAAMPYFEEYLSVSQELVRHDPDNPDWQLELAYAHQNLGAVFDQRGEFDAALAAFRAALELQQGLVERDPANDNWQRELAGGHSWLGAALEANGELDAALDNYRADLSIMQGLTAKDPDDPEWRWLMRIGHRNVGTILEAVGDLEGAIVELEVDLRVAQELYSEDPDNNSHRYDLAVTRRLLGSALLQAGRLDAAAAQLSDSTGALREMLASDPSNMRWRRDLATSLIVKARSVAGRGDWSAALGGAREALSVLEPALEADADDRTARIRRAEALLLIGNAQRALRREEEAVASFDEALEIIEPVAARSRSFDALEPYARALMSLDRLDEARPVVERLRDIGFARPRFVELARAKGLVT